MGSLEIVVCFGGGAGNASAEFGDNVIRRAAAFNKFEGRRTAVGVRGGHHSVRAGDIGELFDFATDVRGHGLGHNQEIGGNHGCGGFAMVHDHGVGLEWHMHIA